MRKSMVLGVALSGLLLAAPAFAQWYVSGGGVYVTSDNARVSDADLGPYLGVGRYLGDKFGLELDYSSYDFQLDDNVNEVEIDGLTLTGRVYLLGNQTTSPYVGLAAGSLDHDGPVRSGDDYHFDILGGLHWDLSQRVGLNGEVRYRFDSDDKSIAGRDDFDDWLVSVGLTVALGSVEQKSAPQPAPAPTPAPAPPAAVTPAAPVIPAAPVVSDGDRDGVADHEDECPDTQAGQIVGSNGCPKAVVIELNGVNFDFDKDTLRPDATRILDQAVQILSTHGGIEVAVDGHTDAVGTDAYNQDLSRRRAKRVYDYLVSHGIAAGRLSWNGYGESRPLASNDTDAGRARNRRVELQVK